MDTETDTRNTEAIERCLDGIIRAKRVLSSPGLSSRDRTYWRESLTGWQQSLHHHEQRQSKGRTQ